MVLHTDCKSVDLGFDSLWILSLSLCCSVSLSFSQGKTGHFYPNLFNRGYSLMVESRTSNSPAHVRFMLPLYIIYKYFTCSVYPIISKNFLTKQIYYYRKKRREGALYTISQVFLHYLINIYLNLSYRRDYFTNILR